jgi:hypothetical protein
VSFGLSFAIDPWIQAQGFARANGEIGLFVLVVGCVGIPVAFLGKRFRANMNCQFGTNEGGALRPQ